MGMADIGSGDARQLVFGQRGRATQIIGLAVSNWLLTILTVGFYRFWARTRVRRYLWGTTTINNQALDYTGRGGELFWSFIAAMAFFFVPLVSLNYAFVEFGFLDSEQLLLWVWAVNLTIIVIANYAIYRARAYLLSRTRWQGVRFAQSGSGVVYGLLALLYTFLSILTLGIFVPFATVRLAGRMRRNTWFGDRRFAFSGSGWALVGPFLVSIIVTVIAVIAIFSAAAGALVPIWEEMNALDPGWNLPPDQIGELLLTALPVVAAIYLVGGLIVSVIWAYYGAYRLNFLAQHTSLEGIQFRMRATGFSLMWLRLGNFLIVTLTLGLGVPFAQVRLMRYMLHRLEAEGDLDLEATLQSGEKQPRFGEGLADGLNVLPI
jgi:uncharacterized membrane protein YjgN (DUF898 family)